VPAQTSFSITNVVHEDLADICTILDSFQTPLFSSSPKIRATDVVHSWTLDTLVAAQTAHAADASAFNNAWPTQTAPQRLNNAVVTFSNNIEVGDQARAINPAGIRDFYDHQVMKSFKQIARDCEAWLFATGASASSEASSVVHAASAYGMFGFPMVVSNAPGGVTTAHIIAISEALFNAGAEPDSMWFAPANKRQFVAQVSGTEYCSRGQGADSERRCVRVPVQSVVRGHHRPFHSDIDGFRVGVRLLHRGSFDGEDCLPASSAAQADG
jgi:hypothetical protein